MTDWAALEADLATVGDYGMDAVGVDVWWGDVEGAAENRLALAYYDRVFATTTAAGLDLAPILSFHQAGGNVGDDYTSLLPSWLWEEYAAVTHRGVLLGPTGLQHRSEQGNTSAESVQGWPDHVVMGEYPTSPGPSRSSTATATPTRSSRSTSRSARPASCATPPTTSTTRAPAT